MDFFSNGYTIKMNRPDVQPGEVYQNKRWNGSKVTEPSVCVVTDYLLLLGQHPVCVCVRVRVCVCVCVCVCVSDKA